MYSVCICIYSERDGEEVYLQKLYTCTSLNRLKPGPKMFYHDHPDKR